MRKRTGTACTALVVLAAWAGACVGDPADNARGPALKLSADQRAITACVTAFVSRMLPTDGSHIRTLIPTDYPRVFTDVDASNRESAKVMELSMTAYGSGGGKPLAKAECIVSAGARVLDLSLVALDRAGLEHLTMNDLKLTLTKGS